MIETLTCCIWTKMLDTYFHFNQLQHVGWWSPTIIRGEDREAVHIPNHKFTVNVVRNLSQKTHWRIKTHLAISHLDVNKINVSILFWSSLYECMYICYIEHTYFMMIVCLSLHRTLLQTCGKSWRRTLKLNNRDCIEEYFWKTWILKIRHFWSVFDILA